MNSLLFRKVFGELRQMAFPFAEFPDEYFEFKLKHEEILVNQFNGEIVSKVEYPVYKVLSILSFKLHTGEGTVIWTSILGLTSIAMLFFIYSGFAIYFKRDKMKISNPKSADIAKIVILYGSEQGRALRFANALHIALLSSGKKIIYYRYE